MNYDDATSEQRERMQRWIHNRIGYNQTSLIELLLSEGVFEYPDVEVIEWWQVEDSTATHLEGEGEYVLRTDYGNWWGRTCNGQSLILDSVFWEMYDV